ncbi:lantibiotic dehydratase [Actinocorallia sp. A-T 12471]|uniref:lantibiotic dehydratase n=1 Tax=Actinocorallia sp. A-T 12471 TaxID=3089813 RepID=UPI0029CEC79A|nr:lantibiotic dehydratase [Actinocorallia sp. A-T 12471]MDX6743614.1 lantibiotic dehydratase [Actinocorallia sp. A-T 12471]
MPLLPASGGGVGSAELLDEAISLASPAAQEAAERGGPGSLTRRAYGIRAQTRATPHGVFAGVADAFFAETTDLRLGSDHRTVTYPDPAWLNRLVSEVMNGPDGMGEATVTTNNLTVTRGDRYEIEAALNDSATRTTTSVRATDVTRFVLESCREGRRAATVLAELATRWPAGPAKRLLRELLDSGFLLHDLVPDDPRSDPLGHLLLRLPADSSRRQRLDRLRALLIEADRHRPGTPKRLAFLTDALATARDLMPADRILRVDTAVDATVTLPAEVARKAAETASLLWRIGWGTDPLDGYHQRFLTRYSTARAVPLLELLDPVVGLGPVEEMETIGAAADDPTRSAVLARLLADAAAHGRTEIVLDAADVDLLTNRAPASAPRTAEISFRLLADPTASCPFQIVVSGGSQNAGSTSRRFSPLLGVAPAPPADETAPVDAELVVRPRRASLASVSAQTSVARRRIPIGVPSRPGDLDLAALTVFSDGHRLIVWSQLLGRPIRPVLRSRIALPLLPSAARFLAMAGHSGERPWHCWTWGSLKAPFTPAVRYRDAWLTTARWTLPHHLASASSSADRWDRTLASWRRTVVPPLPDVVVTDDSDRQLVLDLSRADDRELLRRYVRRGLAAVTAPPGTARSGAVIPGPHGDHALELVVSLDRAGPQNDRPAPSVPSPRRTGDGLYLPGGPWLSLALQAPAACHEPILISLERWIQDAPVDWDRWFWLRFHDSRHGEHLRVRFQGDPALLYGTLLPSLATWATDQRARRLISGLCVEPYEQETERYGGPEAITAAERFFDADSRLGLRLLSASRREEQRLAAAANAAVEIAQRMGGGTASLRRRLDRADHHRMNVLRPHVRRAAPMLGNGWEATLDAYATALSRPDEAIASDLIHMHCNRLAPGDEPLVRALAADLIAHRVHLTEGSPR